MTTGFEGRRPWQRLQMTKLEAAVLLVFAVASFSVFALHAIHALADNRVFLGADGPYPNDQAQYLAWATDSAHHILIRDLYAVGHGAAHVFLLWLVTGMLHVYGGLSYPLLMAFWKLTAIVALFVAVRAYARAHLGTSSRQVAIALLLALFMASPS